ncbi:hypothetical protein GCM10022631_07590 [Deinococcus rubellus]
MRKAVFIALVGSLWLGAQARAQSLDLSSVILNVPGMGSVVAGDNGKQTLDCKGGSVSVSGNGNRLTLTGKCTQVIVAGNKNTVRVAMVGEIVMSGDSNTVTWQKALKGTRPRLVLAGKANTVSKK